MTKPRPSTNHPVPVSTKGAGLTVIGPRPQFNVTSPPTSVVISTTAGVARRIASWTESAAVLRGAPSQEPASCSPIIKALIVSATYQGARAADIDVLWSPANP